jgi:hypothetical protein
VLYSLRVTTNFVCVVYAGLRGMLWEMRGRRPSDTPYGHTQHLTPYLKPGTTVSKVISYSHAILNVHCCDADAGSAPGHCTAGIPFKRGTAPLAEYHAFQWERQPLPAGKLLQQAMASMVQLQPSVC